MTVKALLPKIFINERKQLRTGWKLLRVMAVFILLAFFMVLLANVIQLPGASKYVLHPAMIGASIFCACVLEHKRMKEIGIAPWKGNARHFVFGFVLFFLASCVIALISYMMGNWEIEDGFGAHLLSFTVITNFLYWLLIVSGEEILFRGYMIAAFENKKVGIVCSSLLFASLHVFNPEYTAGAFLCIWISGIVLGIAYVKTGNLWMGVGCHLANNWFQETIFQLPYAGEYMTACVLAFAAVILLRLPANRERASQHQAVS